MARCNGKVKEQKLLLKKSCRIRSKSSAEKHGGNCILEVWCKGHSCLKVCVCVCVLCACEYARSPGRMVTEGNLCVSQSSLHIISPRPANNTAMPSRSSSMSFPHHY